MSEFFSPKEGLRLLLPALQRQSRRIIPLLGVDRDQRITAKGTGTLIRFRRHQFVVTARHVVEGLREAGRPLMTAIAALAQSGETTRNPEVATAQALDLGPALIERPELDISAFLAPRNLLTDERLGAVNK